MLAPPADSSTLASRNGAQSDVTLPDITTISGGIATSSASADSTAERASWSNEKFSAHSAPLMPCSTIAANSSRLLSPSTGATVRTISIASAFS